MYSRDLVLVSERQTQSCFTEGHCNITKLKNGFEKIFMTH